MNIERLLNVPTVQVTLRADGGYTPENELAETLALIAKNGEGQITAEDMTHILAIGFAVEVLEPVNVQPFIRREYDAYRRVNVSKPLHVRDHA